MKRSSPAAFRFSTLEQHLGITTDQAQLVLYDSAWGENTEVHDSSWGVQPALL
jgi:hypothetical protein